MKTVCTTAAISLCLLFTCTIQAQEYKTLATITNAFADRKDEWKEAKKMDFGVTAPKGVSISLGGDGLAVNNTKNDKRLWIGNPTNKKYEQECWQYANGRLSVTIKQVAGDATMYSGLQTTRRSDISTVRSNWGKTIDGKMDYRDRSFTFLINGNGDVKIIAARVKPDDAEETLFTAAAAKGFVAAGSNTISIEKKTLTWNFYLNNSLLFTTTDNSYGGFSTIDYAAAPGNKINFDAIAMLYYDNPYAPYARLTSDITTYLDNECGFKILEGNIENLCPTAEFNNGTVRYVSLYCEKQVKDYSYSILFYKKGQKANDPLADFLDNYLKDLYGTGYNAEALKAKKAVTEKGNELQLVEQIKAGFVSINTTATGITYSEVKDLTAGDIAGRCFDISFTLNGAARTERKFFGYLPKGMILVQFDAPAGALDNNAEYKATVKNIFSL
ncbi:hypothetical protein [Ferruginibacter profundus]